MKPMNQPRLRLREEARIIPPLVIGLAVLVFAGVNVLLYTLLVREPNPPSILFITPFGLTMGGLAAFFVLLVGYINVDAGRRGMNRWLWTLLAIFIPNLIGCVLYFVFRQPLEVVCPRCGMRARAGFNYCPSCSYALHPSCPKCKASVRNDDAFCPYCGANLALHNHSETR